jgi:hypothetical protein
MPRPDRTVAGEVWLATPTAADRLDPARLGPEERAEWDTLRSARRRLDWASSRALLAAVPAAAHQARSLSHSHGFAALACVSATYSVGVDVEWLAPRDFLSMARTAFSADEADGLESLGDPAAVRAMFYEIWTLKEAFAKALQLPLVDALRRCRIAGDDRIPSATVPTDRPWRATVFVPRPQLRLAVVLLADNVSALTADLATIEWPPRQAVSWPIARRLAGPAVGITSTC